MEDRELSNLASCLRQRRDSVADAWFRSLAMLAFSPLPSDQVRRHLAGLVDMALDGLLAETLPRHVGQEIGASLWRLHCIHPEALSKTFEALGGVLIDGVPQEEFAVLWPRLAALQQGIAAGFVAEATETLLAEQESIRNALVSELAAAQADLRTAHDLLEQRVRERTEELARTNELLRLEIGERIRAEESLRAREERYRDLVRSIDAIIVQVDAQGVIQYISPPAGSILGVPTKQIIGRPFLEFLLPEAVPDALERFGHVLNGESDVTDYPSRVASGEVRWLRGSFGPVHERGRVVGALGVLTDITELRRTQEALRASEERWRSFLKNAPDVILSLDRAGTILYVNHVPIGADFSAEDLLGQKADELAMVEHRGRLTKALRRVFELGESASYEVAVRRSRGAVVWYSCRVAPLQGPDGISGALLVAHDITERKQVEDIKDSAIRDVAHELRAPLAKMEMSLDLLQETLEAGPLPPDKARQYLRLARENVARLLNTLGAILALSALEAGASPFRMTTVRVPALLRRAVKEMQPLAASKGLQLILEVPDMLFEVRGDQEKLSRVLVNLLDNACKFSTAGSVVVSAVEKAGEVEVAVRDPGVGISPENLERVFEKFFQEDSHCSGVGLGLTLCRAIIEGHGGRIWAESEGHGRGTTIRFTLPLSVRPSTSGRTADGGSHADRGGGDG